MRILIALMIAAAFPSSALAQWSSETPASTYRATGHETHTIDFTTVGDLPALSWSGCFTDALGSFDASIGDGSTDAEVDWYACEESNQSKNQCARIPVPDGDFTDAPISVGRPWLRPFVRVPPTGGDTARIVAKCSRPEILEASAGGGLLSTKADLEACLATDWPGASCVMDPSADWSTELPIVWDMADTAPTGEPHRVTLDCNGGLLRETGSDADAEMLSINMGAGHDHQYILKNCGFIDTGSGASTTGIVFDNTDSTFGAHVVMSEIRCGWDSSNTAAPEHCFSFEGDPNGDRAHFQVSDSHFESTEEVWVDTVHTSPLAFTSYRYEFTNVNFFGSGASHTDFCLDLRFNMIYFVNVVFLSCGSNRFADSSLMVQNTQLDQCGNATQPCWEMDTGDEAASDDISHYQWLFARGLTIVGGSGNSHPPIEVTGEQTFGFIDIEATNATVKNQTAATFDCLLDGYYTTLATNQMIDVADNNPDPDPEVRVVRVNWTPRWDEESSTYCDFDAILSPNAVAQVVEPPLFTILAGDLDPRQTYTPSNLVTDRAFDADSTTLDEVADVLGTLIEDFQNQGLAR